MVTRSRTELEELKQSFKQSLEVGVKSLNDNSTNILHQITPANVANPIQEFGQVTKLIKAHTTKVGIIFKPENLKSDDVSAAYSTFESLVKSGNLLLTLNSQLTKASISQLYQDEIKYASIQLYTSLIRLADCLSVEGESSDDSRLKSVGLVWSNCDSLVLLIDEGEVGVLNARIKSNIALIDDGFEEFVEWTENPVDFDDDDPFGLELSEDEDEDEGTEGTEDAHPPVEENTTNSPADGKTDLINFCKLWIKQIELIKLLLASFKKSLPVTTPAVTIDLINTIQRQLVVIIDRFISDIMMDQVIDDDIKAYTTDITKHGLKLSSIAQDCHKDNEKKAKWYATWSTKFEAQLK